MMLKIGAKFLTLLIHQLLQFFILCLKDDLIKFSCKLRCLIMCYLVGICTIQRVLGRILVLHRYLSTIKRLLQFFNVTCINQYRTFYFRRPLIPTKYVTDLVIYNWWDMMSGIRVRVESEQILLYATVGLKRWHFSQDDLVCAEHIVININIGMTLSINKILEVIAVLTIWTTTILTLMKTIIGLINMYLQVNQAHCSIRSAQTGISGKSLVKNSLAKLLYAESCSLGS